MAPLPWGILASSGGGLTVTATNATLTSDADYYYLTYTNSTSTAGTTTGTLTVDGGQVPMDYLIVAGGGGSYGNMMDGNGQTVFWDYSYHSAGVWTCSACPAGFYTAAVWWNYDYWCQDSYCLWNYYADSMKTVYTYIGAGGGAGGVLTGSSTLNAGGYNLSVGAGGVMAKGVNTSAFGLTAIGGGAGVPGVGNATLKSGGSGGAGGTGTSGQGNDGANGSFDGVTQYPTLPFGNKSCQQAINDGLYSNWSTGNKCYESNGTGGGPLSTGRGYGSNTRIATSKEELGSQSFGYMPAALENGLTALGLRVGMAGPSSDISFFGSFPSPRPPGSGGGSNQMSFSGRENGSAGVVRVRIAKSTMAEVKVAA